jgi:hypothetical protein
MKIDGVELKEDDMIVILNQPNILGKTIFSFLYKFLLKRRRQTENGIYVVTKIGNNDN